MERESLLPPETRADDTPTPAHGNQARTSLDSIRTLSADENGQDNPAPASSQYPCRVQLRSSSYVLMLVSLYMMLALFSWAVTCILTVRPITTARYGTWRIVSLWQLLAYSSGEKVYSFPPGGISGITTPRVARPPPTPFT